MITARATKAFVFMAALGFAVVGDADLASARALRWDLQNVTFDDGGTVSGFFLFDADLPLEFVPDGSHSVSLASWDITVEGEAPPCNYCFPPFRFTPSSTLFAVARNSGDDGTFNFLLLGPSFYDPIGRNTLRLRLTFDSLLSDAGGTVALTRGGSYEYFDYLILNRPIATGQVVAIPEPSKALLLALGLAALVGFSARRRN